jgi:hypothetical protein
MSRYEAVSANAIWPKENAIPRLDAPKSSASADASANAPSATAIRTGNVTL